MPSRVILLVGCSGSGKSTYVQDQFPEAVVVSADHYFEELATATKQSFEDRCRILLKEVGAGELLAPNLNLDDGHRPEAAEYVLADAAYAKLLGQLAAKYFKLTTPGLRGDILRFYADLGGPLDMKTRGCQWQATMANLDQLKAMPQVPVPVGDPVPSVGPGH